MKADAPKRKIFNDAVDLLSSGEQVATGSGVEMLDIDTIKPFRHHPFRLYEGERLDDMVESIKEHGVLNPVIVRTVHGTYEMLSGHNRQNAAKLAGLKQIPAFVKEILRGVGGIQISGSCPKGDRRPPLLCKIAKMKVKIVIKKIYL